MFVTDLFRAFATVFPAELPDKTMIATVVLVARYRRPFWVWLGAVGAFTFHVTVAVAAGSVIGLLPERVVGAVVAAMFAVGAIVLFRSARADRTAVADAEAAARVTPASAQIPARRRVRATRAAGAS